MANWEGDGLCVELWASDGHVIEVLPAVASQLGVIRKRIIEPCKKRKNNCPRAVYQLPGITRDTLEAVVICCKGFLQPPEEWPLYKNYVVSLHLRTLFNVIQAAYHLQIERLMDLSCEALFVKLEGKQCQQILRDSVIDQDNVQILNDAEIFSFFRKRSQEVTKNESLFVYKQCPPLMKTHLDFVDRRKNNFLRIVSIMMTACMVNGEMKCVLEEMHVYVSCDPGLADHLDHAHVECLVNIVRSDISSTDVKGLALNILAYATSEVYDEVRQAIPLLLKLLGVQDIRLPVLVALYSLANAFPVYREDVIDGDALEELLLIVDDFQSEILLNAARLLDVVCRGSNLAPRQIEVAHNISLVLFEKLYDYPDYKTHMVHTCSALRYLYDNGPLEMGEKFLTMLMGLLLRSNFSSNCAAVSWSALGVVGNIVRLGKDDKIKFLISRCKLLQCLVTVMITRQGKDFHMEACRIISNISVRNRTLIEEMDKANMITILCSLLKKSDYDVKLEAAWAIFTGIYGNRKLKIDVYPKWKDDFDNI